MKKKLTNTVVESFKGGQRYESGKRAGQLVEQPVIWDALLPGFGLRYGMKTGVRAYIFQCRVKGGTERTLTIARHGELRQLPDKTFAIWDVESARRKAYELRALLTGGIDPIIEEHKAKEAAAAQAEDDRAMSVTLRQVMEHYVENKRTKHGPLRAATKASIKETIERYLADWLDLPMVTTVTRDACLARFIELSDNETNRKTGLAGKKGAANMTMVYVRALANYARDLYERADGTPRIFLVNPITRMMKVRKLNPEAKRKDRVPRDRIGHVWNALRDAAANARTDAERTAADWVSTILLTGMRLSESASLKRSQVDRDAKTLRLLSDVVKNHNELLLPLSGTLHEILEARLTTAQDDSPAALRRRRERSAEYLFPSFGKKRPYVTDARATFDMVSKVAGCRISPHSLRRTYESVLQYAKVDPDVRRVLLNHLAEDVHQASYANDDSDDALRPAVEAAAAWIVEQGRIAAAGNVVQLQRKAG